MSFFGYDPIDKQFKLLAKTRRSPSGRNVVSEEHQILTLGYGTLLWRMIECGIPHDPLSGGICINGILYYQANFVRGIEGKFIIVCFDIRSEKFKLIEKEDKAERAKLVNYKGKLATLRSDNRLGLIDQKSRSIELCVLEDAEKLEWSTHTYVLPPLLTDVASPCGIFHFTGVTRTGEIVFSPYFPHDPFYLVYYNLERNSVIKVEVQGIDVAKRYFQTFIDHIEDVKLGGVFKT